MRSDVLKPPVRPDRIDLNDPEEVRRWVETYGVTFHELRAAVMKAGPSADAVRRILEETARERMA